MRLRLYHYTSAEGLRAILSEGIRPSGVGDARAVWLTESDSYGLQVSWAPRPVLGVDRAEARVEVAIPPRSLDRLVRWDEWARAAGIGGFRRPGHDTWWLYFGPIPRPWLRSVGHRVR